MLDAGNCVANSDRNDLFASLANSRGLLLAVSGGPDSTALLLLIDRWRESAGVPVAVATVDHGVRPDSAAEADGVAKLCAARRLPHHTLVWAHDGVRTRVQERARIARYALLVACAKDIGADTILTGHHADDQAETILMRLTRGSGIAGLAGMAATSMRDGVILARPLLDMSKADLVAVCEAEGVAAVSDPSNHDAKYRRTALRTLVPALAAEGLDAKALAKLSRRAARAETALVWALAQAQALVIVARDDNCITLLADAFAGLPIELAQRVLMQEFEWLVAGTPRLEQVETFAKRLTRAVIANSDFAATLAGCKATLRFSSVVTGRARHIVITRAPARRRPV